MIANDLSASAVEDIRRNIAYNGLAPKGIASLPGAEGLPEEEVKPGREWSKADIEEAKLGKVRANEGDAWSVERVLLLPEAKLSHRERSLTERTPDAVSSCTNTGRKRPGSTASTWTRTGARFPSSTRR